MAKKPEIENLEQLLQNLNEDLYFRFKQIKNMSLNDIAPRQQRVDDTGSAGFHYMSVHRIVDKLVPPDKLQNYKEIEVFVLLCSIYLHDIGKTCPIDLEKHHHAERGLEAVVSAAPELRLSEPESMAIGYVIKAHGPDPLSQLPKFRGVGPFGNVRIQYFGALLRLADDLDMCFTRAPKLSRKLVKPCEEIIGKWDLRGCVENVEIAPHTWTIEIQATPHTTEEYSSLLREVESINARINESRIYLEATPDIGLYYKLLDVKTDPHWLHLLASQEKPSIKTSGIEKNGTNVVIATFPKNTAVVITRQDPASSKEYSEIVAPCLQKVGYVPLRIEDIPPSGSLLDRAVTVIKAGELIVANISDNAAPSIHFRLGVAAALGKEVILYSREQAAIAGDCSGMRVLTYDNAEDLKKKLMDILASSRSHQENSHDR